MQKLYFGVSLCAMLVVAGCTVTPPDVVQDSAPDDYVDVSHVPDAVPRAERKSRYGNPDSYLINGKRYYVLQSADDYNVKGMASWYGTKFHGQLTSTREPYDMLAMTAASPNLPLPCYARVTNLENGRSVVVRVNDRGPFAKGRVMDLSYAAAKKLGYANKGTAYVEVKVIPTKFAAVAPDQYYLQAGAFRQKQNANRLQQELQTLIEAPVAVMRQATHKVPYIVRVGPVATTGKMQQLRTALQSHGIHAFVTPIKG